MRRPTLILISVAIAFMTQAALASGAPKLAESPYPISNAAPGQTGAVAAVGPVDTTRELTQSELRQLNVGPGMFSSVISGKYLNGRRVIWGLGPDRVVKIDAENFQLLSTFYRPGRERVDVDKVEPPSGLIGAWRAASRSEYADSPFTLIDNNNVFHALGADRVLTAYGDSILEKAESDIVELRRFVIPDVAYGQPVGLNMVGNGSLVITTDAGFVIAVDSNFENSSVIELQGLPEDAADRSAQLVSNVAAGDGNGLYVQSANHLHKLMVTENGLSQTPEDGAWRVKYASNASHATKTPPTLFGEGSTDLVAIVVGQRPATIHAYWRNQIPDGWPGLEGHPKRLAGSIELPLNGETHTRHALTAYQSALLFVDTTPREKPWYISKANGERLYIWAGLDERVHSNGMVKVRWDESRQKLLIDWEDQELSTSATAPLLATGNNMLYNIGIRSGRWTLNAIDWHTGQSRFRLKLPDSDFHPVGAPLMLDHRGRLHGATHNGRFMIENRAN